MLVEINRGFVTGPNKKFGSDPFAEVRITATSSRSFREVGIVYPGMISLPVWDGNPEIFELDPDRLGLANEILPAGSTFNAKGVIGFEITYEFWPKELTVTAANLPVEVRALNICESNIATINLFRLFDDVDDGRSFFT